MSLLCLLILIVALKFRFFLMLPVWDEAFSIFPAADFLVKHDFDYSLLLTQPNYHDGGPTAHALSLLTFFRWRFVENDRWWNIGLGDFAHYAVADGGCHWHHTT